jgi:hypothetical protein
MPILPTVKKLRQEDHEFQPCLIKTKQKLNKRSEYFPKQLHRTKTKTHAWNDNYLRANLKRLL